MDEVEEEIPHSAILSNIFEKEELQDVILQGNDSVKVSSCRSVLAARSKVLEKMLVGNFSEAAKRVVEIPYPGAVLQALVEYIFLDFAPTVAHAADGNQLPEFRHLLYVAGAAKYFDLPILARKVYLSLSKTIEELPSSAFALLEACQQEGLSVPEALWKHASKCALSGNVAINRETVAILSAEALNQLLKQNKQLLTDYKIFDIIQKWAASDGETRKLPAMNLTKYVRLEKIHPSLLSTTVTQSDLVSIDQINEAYKTIALHLHDYGMVGVDSIDSRPVVWAASQSTILEPSDTTLTTYFVQYPPMTSGIHQWAIAIEETAEEMAYFGIAVPGAMRPDRSVFQQSYGWVYNSHEGRTYHASQTIAQNLPKCNDGSIVHFKLNLAQDAEHFGTFGVSLDGGSTFQVLFRKLNIHLLGVEGFVPVVGVCAPGRLRLLDLKQVDPAPAP